MKAPTPCLQSDCHENAVREGRCPTHQRPPWVGSTRNDRLPPDWNTRKLIVMKRDGGVCHLCGQPGADTIDHIVAGDDHSLGNLAPAHMRVPPYCHQHKSSREGHEAKQGYKTKQRH